MKEKDAATHIQRTIRGRLGVTGARKARQQRLVATDMQRIFRAMKGRRRMQAKRDLKRYGEAKLAIDLYLQVTCLSFRHEQPKPIVVALMTCIRILWPAGQGPPQPAGADCYRGSASVDACDARTLPRLRNLADAAIAEVLQVKSTRIKVCT